MSGTGRKVSDRSPQAAARREYQRRYRRHKAGDHSLCEEGKCPAKTVVSAQTALEKRMDLGETGTLLWREMTQDGPIGPMQSVLLLEACRIADRLDQLDRQLRGEDWLRFRHDDSGLDVHVYVDKVLAEAREQAIAFKNIVAELRQVITKGNVPGKTQNSGVSDLVARIAAKRSAQASG